MVSRILTPVDNGGVWELVDNETGKTLSFPTVIMEELKGKYISAEELLSRISTIKIAFSGMTDSLNIIDDINYDRRSALQTFGLNGYNTIDQGIDEFLTSVADYEKYHTIKMDRDVPGDDSSIHAYIETPKDGRLRCVFDQSVRVYAKRNNVNYWIEDYTIDAGSNDGKFIRPVGEIEEIL
jgi:hypothetical protein